jgi:predicted small lipoprotein YifL
MDYNILKNGTRVLLLVILVGSLAACGVKSSPRHPGGSTFPRQYPTALPPSDVVPVNRQRQSDAGILPADPDSFYQYPNTPPKLSPAQ